MTENQGKPKAGTGTLKRGLKVGETIHKDFELREATAGDVFAAEAEADPSRPTTFRSALAAQQLVRIGAFEGPFTLTVLAKLTGRDLSRILDAQLALDIQGEEEQPG